ncbi:sodium/proline symporter [Isoptericola cucumis]|uniref:Sodium/proline symporter n=1 Tax=Isoptericola cucumis TaxID=1776856 RepID=A0ABQ2B8V5_9MICO|nr:sodium/proline symporter [Isoptericola cucumis]GGI10442.1 sodium:proline symporter [Isoptericola cucumis]
MDSSTTPSVVAFVLYLVVMLGIGVWFMRQNDSVADFAIGGRRLGTFTATLSAKATDSSSWVFLGLPGAFYVSGMQNVWMIVGLTVGFYVSWRLVAGRLREHSELGFDWRSGRRSESVTLPAYLANRFHSDSLRLVSAVFIMVFYVVYLGSGLVATGLMFGQVFGVSNTTGILIGAGVVMVYSCLGGFLASSYTDVVQGILMFVSLAVVSVVALVNVGGPAALAQGVADANPDLASPFVEVALEGGEWVSGSSVAVVAIVSALAWGLGYFGQPHILARFMGLRTSESTKSARRLGVFLSVTLLGFAGVIGMLAVVTFGPGLDNPENAYAALVDALLPSWMVGIFLAGILAAIMSTADSQLVVAATTLSEDFYRAFVNRAATDRTLVWISRVTVILVSAVAVAIALRGGTVLGLVSYAWAGFGAAFGPVVLAALYSRRTTWVGALAGMLAGGITVVVYPLVDTIGLYELVPGFAAGLLGVWVGNRLGPAPSEQVRAQYDAVRVPAPHAERVPAA